MNFLLDSAVLNSLTIMWQSMLGIFVVMGIIAIIVWVLKKINFKK